MCGIVGILNGDGAPVDPVTLEAMTAALGHRGPDGRGVHVEGPLGLGHTRLAVVDVSSAGRQPMSNEDGTVWIVFNGEIYNFRELRRFLDSLGHDPKYRWRSHTDTEVVLHLYEEFGSGCLPYLSGMFAFAIWDAQARRLFLVRDRLGVKPLTYQQDAHAFRFASEAKGILADLSVERAPDLEAISHYLTYGYVPSPLSAFRGFHQLPPGHAMLVQDGTVLSVWRWWEPARAEKRGWSGEDYASATRELVTKATAARLVADVPIGVLLSGGVDSSAVVWAMRAQGHRPRTFCMGFADAGCDERPHARAVARHFDADHLEFEARVDPVALLPALAHHYDEPFGDSSALPTYLLAQEARKAVTVVLTGDGGDEAFGGYRRYLAHRAAMRIPGAEEAGTYARWFCTVHGERWARLTTPEFQEAARADGLPLLRRLLADSTGSDPTDRAMDVDTRLYLPDDLLVKVDRATMAHGLEARSPFLDHRLVEYAASIPSGEKVGWRETKRILKHALWGLLPDAILARPKMGFGVPLASWLRGVLREAMLDAFTSRRFAERGWVRPAEARQMVDQHLSGQQDAATPLWYLLMLELWARTWLDAVRRDGGG